MSTLSLIPETAPFSPEQRAWLNGFLSGWLGIPGTESTDPPLSAISTLAPVAEAEIEEEQYPWHEPDLAMDQRMELASDQPLPHRLMAAMAQLDCGACGYVCKTYSEAIATGEETSLTLCSPGGKDTAKMLKKLLKEGKEESVARPSQNGHVAAPAVNGRASKVHDRKNPFAATILESRNLNREESAKHTAHVAIDLAGSDLRYRVGDSLGVYPTNCPDLVDSIIQTLNASGEERVTPSNGSSTSFRSALSSFCNLRDVDEDLIDLFLESTPECAEQLHVLKANEDQLDEMDLLDLILEVPDVQLNPQALVERLQRLTPRLYSIASSQDLHPNQVHLTVARATTQIRNRLRKGVASTMFADRVAPGDIVKVFVHSSDGFTLPSDNSTPIIMVGPGTGVAPFRAFLQQRQAEDARGESWLFFGDQRRDLDFLYEDEFQTWLDTGTLTRLTTAFSRDQEHKVYVQDRMRENGADLFQWLERGAHFYVCGDAKRMAGDVDRALRDIISEHGKRTAADADAYLAEMTKSKRYCRDVY